MVESKANILIIDDEEGIRDIFSETLEEAGYSCRTAAGGEVALSLLSSEAFDLALVDIMMPKMSGLTFFDFMKGRYPDVAVIFITAMDDVKIAVRNLNEGAYDYLVKPVTMQRLQQSVVKVLSKRNGLLEEKQRQADREEEHQKQLAQRSLELRALNRLFQRHLQERAETVDAYQNVTEGLRRLAQNASTLAEAARSHTQSPPQEFLEEQPQETSV